jgi:hypothetical protein
MLPTHTRPADVLRSPSPVRPDRWQREPATALAQAPNRASDHFGKGDAEAGAVVSVKAVVREYERVRAELARLSVQTQSLRTRSNQVRQLIESFMRERDLKRIATKSGDIVIKFVERSSRVRPSRRDTEKCILDALGPEHSDVADRLINDLFEAKKEKRQVTKVITPT